MLAYVFWHWPQPGIAVADYETHMRTFQDALAARGPSELRAARAWRVNGASWLPSGAGYEEWYLLDNSAALDALNHGAVSGPLAEPHNTLAALAAGGAGGLFQTVSDQPGIPAAFEAAIVRWFAKPSGMPYPDLYARLGDTRSRLWRRMMVLGPTLEFCVMGDSDDDPAVPAGWQPLVVHREPVWPMPDQR